MVATGAPHLSTVLSWGWPLPSRSTRKPSLDYFPLVGFIEKFPPPWFTFV